MRKCRIIIVLVLLVASSLFLNSCVYIYIREKSYYKDEKNYSEFSGEISFINLLNDKVYFSVTSDDVIINGETFVIKGSNFKILDAAGFFDEISIGQSITFICAPKIMGDGYCPPVATVLTENGYIPCVNEGISNIYSEY